MVYIGYTVVQIQRETLLKRFVPVFRGKITSKCVNENITKDTLKCLKFSQDGSICFPFTFIILVSNFSLSRLAIK